MNRTIYLIAFHFFVIYMKVLLVEMCIHQVCLNLSFSSMFWFYGSSVILTFISFPCELSFSVYELSHSSLMFHFVPEISLMFNIHR